MRYFLTKGHSGRAWNYDNSPLPDLASLAWVLELCDNELWVLCVPGGQPAVGGT
jgi:hypothetical protein